MPGYLEVMDADTVVLKGCALYVVCQEQVWTRVLMSRATGERDHRDVQCAEPPSGPADRSSALVEQHLLRVLVRGEVDCRSRACSMASARGHGRTGVHALAPGGEVRELVGVDARSAA